MTSPARMTGVGAAVPPHAAAAVSSAAPEGGAGQAEDQEQEQQREQEAEREEEEPGVPVVRICRGRRARGGCSRDGHAHLERHAGGRAEEQEREERDERHHDASHVIHLHWCLR